MVSIVEKRKGKNTHYYLQQTVRLGDRVRALSRPMDRDLPPDEVKRRYLESKDELILEAARLRGEFEAGKWKSELLSFDDIAF